MGAVEIVLAAAALLIGLTGAWSPCGFSMVETIGPSGHTGGRRTTFAALATFVPGALIGGMVTFASLAALGELIHGAGGELAYAAAAVIALLAAIAEARGLPIVPQVRRQLPEPWRRLMPMPVAAFLYGILLGLGFTTFVLSFGVWALAGISFAVGDPVAGIAIGLAFGAGRAIPILALAPVCQRPAGIRATELMTQRPSLYRGFRIGDATLLAAAALALVLAVPAGARERAASAAGDPSVSDDELVFEQLGGGSVLRRNGRERRLPGRDPAIGGPFIAVRQGEQIVLLARDGLSERLRTEAAGVDGIAVSRSWIAYRVGSREGDVIRARTIRRGAGGVGAGGGPGLSFGAARTVAHASAPAQLSRPSVFGGTLVYARSTPNSSSILHRALGKGGRKVLVASRRWQLANPSVLGRSFVYVRTTNERQQLRLRRLAARGKDKVVFSMPATSFRDPDHGRGRHRLPTRVPPPDRRRSSSAMWSTALARDRVYLTLLRQDRGRLSARIVRVGR
jgi:hypothetical protein